MSSNRPPQLHLALPVNGTSFKRSFDQFGFDPESPVVGAQPGASGSGSNDRNKRPRSNSEGSLSDDGDDAHSSQSSSSASSSSEATLSSGSDEAGPSRLIHSSEPPRLPTPELQDIEMPYYTPNESPDQPNTERNEQYRASMERFNVFESDIAVLRQSRSVSPPPTLPPLTLDPNPVAAELFAQSPIEPSLPEPLYRASESPTSRALALVESEPPRIEFAPPVSPPLFWQQIPHSLQVDEQPSFQARLDSALAVLRSNSPLFDGEYHDAPLTSEERPQPAPRSTRESELHQMDSLPETLQETIRTLRRSNEQRRSERLASSTSRVIDPLSEPGPSRPRTSFTTGSSDLPSASRPLHVNYADYLAGLFHNDSPPLHSHSGLGHESRETSGDEVTFSDIYSPLRGLDDGRPRSRSHRSPSPPRSRSHTRPLSRFGGSPLHSSRMWAGSPANDREVPPQLRTEVERFSPFQLSFDWDSPENEGPRFNGGRERSVEREFGAHSRWTSTIPDLDSDTLAETERLSAHGHLPFPSPLRRGSGSDNIPWPPHLMRHRPTASNSLLSENAVEMRRGRARADMLRSLPVRGSVTSAPPSPDLESGPDFFDLRPSTRSWGLPAYPTLQPLHDSPHLHHRHRSLHLPRPSAASSPSLPSSSRRGEPHRIGLPGQIDFYAPLPSTRTLSQRDSDSSVYEYIPSRHEPLRLPEPVNSWTNNPHDLEMEVEPVVRSRAPAVPPSLPEPDLGRFIDPLSVLETVRPTEYYSLSTQQRRTYTPSSPPVIPRPFEQEEPAPTPTVSGASSVGTSTPTSATFSSRASRNINLNDYHAGPFRATLQRMFATDDHRSSSDSVDNVRPFSTSQQPHARPPSIPPLEFEVGETFEERRETTATSAASMLSSFHANQMAQHRRAESGGSTQSSSPRSVNSFRYRSRGAPSEATFTVRQMRHGMPTSRHNPDSIDHLHGYLTNRVRLDAARLADDHERGGDGRSPRSGAPETPPGLSHALEVLRPDGLSSIRSQQLIQQYHRERQRPAETQRIPATRGWGDVEDDTDYFELGRAAPWRSRPRFGRGPDAEATTTGGDGPDVEARAGAVPTAAGLDDSASRRAHRRPSSRSPTREPTYTTLSERLARNARLRRSFYTSSTHDFATIGRVRRRFLGDYVRDEDLDTSYEGLMHLAATIGDAKPKHTPEHVIAGLPTGFYKDWATVDSDARCPICLDDYKPLDQVLKLIECNHWLHKGCLEQWLRGASTCPVCRQNVQAKTSNPCRAHGPRPQSSTSQQSQAGPSRIGQPSPVLSPSGTSGRARSGWHPVPSVPPSDAAYTAFNSQNRVRQRIFNPSQPAPVNLRMTPRREALINLALEASRHGGRSYPSTLRAHLDTHGTTPGNSSAAPPQSPQSVANGSSASGGPSPSANPGNDASNLGAGSNRRRPSLSSLWDTFLVDGNGEERDARNGSPVSRRAQAEIDSEMRHVLEEEDFTSNGHTARRRRPFDEDDGFEDGNDWMI